MLALLSNAIAPVTSERIGLRAPLLDDFLALAEIRRDPYIQAMLLTAIQYPDDDAVREWIGRRVYDANGVFLVVADRSSDEALGYVQITDIHHRNRHGTFGIAVRRRFQRQGIGKAALLLLHTLAANDFRLEKLMLTVRTDNVGAVKMYVDAGYRVVGFLERHFRDHDGIRHDVLLLERLLSEA